MIMVTNDSSAIQQNAVWHLVVDKSQTWSVQVKLAVHSGQPDKHPSSKFSPIVSDALYDPNWHLHRQGPSKQQSLHVLLNESLCHSMQLSYQRAYSCATQPRLAALVLSRSQKQYPKHQRKRQPQSRKVAVGWLPYNPSSHVCLCV
jgi:hypothetical protein